MNDSLYKVRDTTELASVIVAKRRADKDLPYLARSVAKTHKEYVLEVCLYFRYKDYAINHQQHFSCKARSPRVR